MLNLESAIEKINQFTPKQREQVIKFIEFIDFKYKQQIIENENTSLSKNQIADDTNMNEKDFFATAGIWNNRHINIDSLRKKA